ncbi:MAG TPA: DUF1552 domain-containing protein [Polyangiaceae bacterium]|nr:DUF1552 domain-containing protein [Polyangiaceae bacterium]
MSNTLGDESSGLSFRSSVRTVTSGESSGLSFRSSVRTTMDRRRFLKLAGATALTYPFLRGMPSYAAGGAAGAPTYLVPLFTSCGCVRYRWGAQGPAGTGMTPAITTPLSFRQTLTAFTKAGPQQQADMSPYVTVIDGLQVKSAGGGSHEAGMAALWTGLTATSGPAPGPSIDQVISSQLGAKTAFANVALMAESSSDYQQRQVDTRMLYDLTGNFVDPYTSPSAALAALFPNVVAAGPDPTTYIRQKVAAQVNRELTALQGRLCTEDRQQMQNLQALYNQVMQQIQQAASASASCSPPSIGDAGAPASGGSDPFPLYVDAMTNILVMTLACDLTRVASLQLSHALSPVTHTWLGSSQTQTHHVYSHMGPSSIYALGTDLYNEPSSVTGTYPQQLIDIENWYAQKVANLAYTLSQFKTSAGNNLLDQTLVCWGSELDMGASHNHDNTPFVLIGGAGGKVKGNRLLRFGLNLTNASNNQCGIRFHNDLLLTLAQIMGVSASQVQTGYGSHASMFSSYATGPITELLS